MTKYDSAVSRIESWGNWVMPQWRTGPRSFSWRSMPSKDGNPQFAVEIENDLDKFDSETKALATYWLLRLRELRLQSDQEARRMMIEWIAFSDSVTDGDGELASGALWQAADLAKQRGWTNDAERIANELYERFPKTYHGNQMIHGQTDE
ncbi:MAG: hypothetical protein R3C03_05470 [Pirellulaceae bacterium]